MMDFNDLYQELILDHNRRPRNRRKLEAPDGTAEGYNPLCGDRITVFVKVEDNVIREVSFDGSGCAISTAAASLMTESLKGKTLLQAEALFKQFHGLLTRDSHDTEEGPELGKLEAFSGVRRYPARVKCATLAWHTVSAALENHKGVVSTE